jgi:NAD(P)-dependent dehydrogenase (short-subunit alcohol dehydrogenase family)
MQPTILITGASKGIGLAIAQRLHAAGYRVFGTGRNPGSEPAAPFTLLPLDVTQPDSVQACVDAVMAQTGRIDVLINNAGYDLYGAAEETDMMTLNAQMDANFYGAVRMTAAVLPIMRAQRSGRIINNSSIGGLLALPYNSAYAASKFALEGYSESLRYELLPLGIYVSLIEPGSVATDTLDTSIREVEANSIYAAQRQRMTQMMRETGAASRLTTQQIAETVYRIVIAARPHLRYPIGTLARFMPILRTLLPQRMYESFMLGQFSTK